MNQQEKKTSSKIFDGRWEVSSAEGLWDSVIVTVDEGVITGSSVRGGVEIGADFKSMRAYWEKFEGENKYLIKKINE
jgi:predicted phosphoribosyltransferase